MSSAYRVDIIPRWVWVFLVLAALLIIITAFSIATTRNPSDIVVIGHEVKTGDPRDFIRQPPTPALPPGEEVTPTPPTTPPQSGVTPSPALKIPEGMPAQFTFNRRSWEFAGGPVTIEVLTTGEHINDHIVYSKQGDQPPFDALYIETAPNSGEFYRYLPVGATP